MIRSDDPPSTPPRPYRGKRMLDMLAAGLACTLFAPAAAALALAVWCDDRGSALFHQARIGCGRRPFDMVKFRSMRDRQVTRVGRWLRSTGLDELPQLVNVCRGEMSVVGPRPLTAADLERLGWTHVRTDWRFAMRPGITGLAQLFGGRGARASLRLDRLYLEKQGSWLDLQLIALSFAANVLGKRTARRFYRAARASSLGRTRPESGAPR